MHVSWQKWPITINFGNNLPRNTVSEQYSNVPLFWVLELGELEYHEIENPNWSETRRREGEEEDEDEDDVAPLSSNRKAITIAPPTTTTFPSPIPSGATATETTIPLPRPSSIRESDHNDVFNFCRRWCEGVRV